jgi:M6 family metalloprotease-like protein
MGLMALSNLNRVFANRVHSRFPTRWRKDLAFRRLEALLLIAISVSFAAPGLVIDGHAVAQHPEAFEFIPPMPQFSTQAPELNFTIPFPVPRPSPVYGQISVLVIAVEFSDYNHTLSIEQVANQTIDRLNTYYNHVSYGIASVVGNVVGWIRVPHELSYYGADNGPFIDSGQNGEAYPDTWKLFRDAAPTVEKQVTITNYQKIVVLHAGYGEESSRKSDDIWSVTFIGQPVQTPQGTFNDFSIVPEFEATGLDTAGVYAHEFGHLLGLPDLYSKTVEEVGLWDVMARGAWNGKPPGSSPAEMLAWDRIFLGWITEQHILTLTKQSRTNATIDPIESPSSGFQAVKIQTPSQDSKHYYLVEVRQQVGFDTALPSSGVLITYIDETKSNPVKVIDAVQTTSTLSDAPFQVGQKYSDSQNNLVISIATANGSSFSVVVDTLAPSTDVAVESLTLDPPTVHPNNTASLLVRVANEGNLKAKPFLVNIYLNETLFASRQISLDAGEEQQIQLSWTPTTGGTYIFKVVLDSENVLSESNKENNTKILAVVVGYTLTLQLRPPGAGADLQWWITVNEVNQTYVGIGEFQIGLLPGSNTLEIQPLIYLNPSSRYVFKQWSDGVTSNSRVITLSSDMTLSVDFSLQFLLSLEPNGGITSMGGWYDSGTPVTITATSPSNVVNGQSRSIFLSWSGDIESNSTTMTVTMTRPYHMIANWKTQYYLNVQSPLAAAGAGWYDANARAVISLNSPVATGNGVRYVFVKWSGDLSGENQSQSIIMSGPKLVSALWATQYELKIESDYGHTTGAGWYEPGTQATFGVDTSVIDLSNDTRRVFTQWSGDASSNSQQGSVTMDGPKAIRADWRTQYLVALMTEGIRNGTVLTIVLNSEPYQVKVPETVKLWLDAGSSISFSTNATASVDFRRYVFQEWRNSTGSTIKSPQNILKPQKYTAVYQELSLFPCIIATVTYGSEVTPEVQFLRNFRDHLVLSTRAGSAFITVFNLWYYSFSPQVADFIVLHDTMRYPLRFALYPLLGILELSSATYSTFSFAPELAIAATGILASALIGLVYLTPANLLIVRLLRRKQVRGSHVLRGCSISLLVAVTMLLLGELIGSFLILAIATSVLVITTLISAPLLFSFELTSLDIGLKLRAKMKTPRQS